MMLLLARESCGVTILYDDVLYTGPLFRQLIPLSMVVHCCWKDKTK
jgi:hypothetical protein